MFSLVPFPLNFKVSSINALLQYLMLPDTLSLFLISSFFALPVV